MGFSEFHSLGGDRAFWFFSRTEFPTNYGITFPRRLVHNYNETSRPSANNKWTFHAAPMLEHTIVISVLHNADHVVLVARLV